MEKYFLKAVGKKKKNDVKRKPLFTIPVLPFHSSALVKQYMDSGMKVG